MTSYLEGPANFVAYLQRDVSRIGHLDLARQTIQPLSFDSGTPVENLYQVIEASAAQYVAAGSVVSVSDVKLLPPISGRDVLAVGKNYMEHAKEFNSSGYDSSDKVDRPSHPVIFTKRATSIIAHGDEIHLHQGFTESADYEGEIGVIIGKAGYRISEEDAWDFVWGYTIINDLTARERQRDHKQFYIGKSPDTFCPMGPIAVAKENLPDQGRSLRLQTHVNGQLRQDATLNDLIFSIPRLIATLSAGQTLQPGDVLATGTPAGVGLGLSPPTYLKSGDEIAISVTGLGTLKNTVAESSKENLTMVRIRKEARSTAFRLNNGEKSSQGRVGLTPKLNGLSGISYQRLGSGDEKFVFIHGLGGTKDYWTPLISTLSLPNRASVHLYDFEGHGLTPTSPTQKLTISHLASELKSVFDRADTSPQSPATVVAHSVGCLIAIHFALEYPDLVKKLVLFGPPPSSLPNPTPDVWFSIAEQARSHGMSGIVDGIVSTQVSDYTKMNNPLAVAAVRLSLLGQDPEAYAKACSALALGDSADFSQLNIETLLVTGRYDPVSSPSVVEDYAKRNAHSRLVVLPNVGHWHVFEDVVGVGQSLQNFL
ncbi:Putative alpha/beta hydrolase-1, fumarylacetoacetase-like protein [Colletotrichum destructivum]|uniref:Alpha/beta hydrolase-1, fumarylacetoacetase-like protein n=1 Tax=Colletotrichum destructivum TaxID=34406 RepID=A0AAX4IIB1_9PEZI|nr:Putative alpha/beta hydrolase-1, fumarylacetoacetase-like protein [Colletotrichum destructivum]